MSVVCGLGTRLRVCMHTKLEKVPVRYRPNAASGGWGYGRDLVHCRDRKKAALTSH